MLWKTMDKTATAMPMLNFQAQDPTTEMETEIDRALSMLRQ